MVTLSVPVVPIQQHGQQMYVGAYSAKAILRIAYVQERREGKGVQRILSASRLEEISNYVQEDEPPGLLPNSILLGLKSTATFDANSRTLKIPERPRSAFVIDGQHRLYAFQSEFSGDFDMTIPVTFVTDVSLDLIAYLFRTINSTQRKINPSLVYDLIPMLRDHNWIEFEDSRAQYLVSRLQDDPGSPWHQRISMLGGRDQPITQASFVTAIKRLLKSRRVFSEEYRGGIFAAQEIQSDILLMYFSRIADVFSREWLNDDYVVSKNLGVSALLNVLEPVFDRIGRSDTDFFLADRLVIPHKRLTAIIQRFHKVATWRRDDMAKSYLGAAGIRRLTDELRAVI